MPFGEEVMADATYRTAGHKYGVGDGVRQKFTGYERDEETGLDFAEARITTTTTADLRLLIRYWPPANPLIRKRSTAMPTQ